MSGLIRRLKPEEEEVLRKREELATIRATLAERELELVDLRTQLAAFEGRYLRQVGTPFSELETNGRRETGLIPNTASQAAAEEARKQARQTHEDAYGVASEAPDFAASPDLKRLFREVAKRIHPDAADQGHCTAQFNPGVVYNLGYECGRGVPQDAEAVGWYRKAADHGNAFALESNSAPATKRARV